MSLRSNTQVPVRYASYTYPSNGRHFFKTLRIKLRHAVLRDILNRTLHRSIPRRSNAVHMWNGINRHTSYHPVDKETKFIIHIMVFPAKHEILFVCLFVLFCAYDLPHSEQRCRSLLVSRQLVFIMNGSLSPLWPGSDIHKLPTVTRETSICNTESSYYVTKLSGVITNKAPRSCSGSWHCTVKGHDSHKLAIVTHRRSTSISHPSGIISNNSKEGKKLVSISAAAVTSINCPQSVYKPSSVTQSPKITWLSCLLLGVVTLHSPGSWQSKARDRDTQRQLVHLVNWCFEPSQPLGIISGLKETFIKRHQVERTKKTEIRLEEQSGKNRDLSGEFTEWNTIERVIKTEIDARTE